MSTVAFRKQLLAIPPYVPGMPEDEAKRRFGVEEVIKLASNECPLGPFPAVLSKIPVWAQQCNRYPDNDCHDLLGELRRYLERPGEEILIGNGSSDIIARIAIALLDPGDEVVVPSPSFPYYEIVAKLAGAHVRTVPLLPDYRYDLQAMRSAISPAAKLVVICNPNNPTGTYVPEAELRAFLDSAPRNVLVIVDEAYFEYAMAGDYASVLHEVDRYENLLVTRTFSKIYGLAGLRIGYAVARGKVAEQVRKAQGPFSVNVLGQMAAAESLRYPGIVHERRLRNAEWRNTLCSGFSSLGVPFVESQANFVMAKLGENSEVLFTEFARRGLIVRPASADGWMRITVGTAEENRRCLRAVEEIAQAPQGGHR